MFLCILQCEDMTLWQFQLFQMFHFTLEWKDETTFILPIHRNTIYIKTYIPFRPYKMHIWKWSSSYLFLIIKNWFLSAFSPEDLYSLGKTHFPSRMCWTPYRPFRELNDSWTRVIQKKNDLPGVDQKMFEHVQIVSQSSRFFQIWIIWSRI